MTFSLSCGTIYKLSEKEAYAPVAQLDRVSDSDSEGHAFESHRAYQERLLHEIMCSSLLLFDCCISLPSGFFAFTRWQAVSLIWDA